MEEMSVYKIRKGLTYAVVPAHSRFRLPLLLVRSLLVLHRCILQLPLYIRVSELCSTLHQRKFKYNISFSPIEIADF
jgi:hypothetical protein